MHINIKPYKVACINKLKHNIAQQTALLLPDPKSHESTASVCDTRQPSLFSPHNMSNKALRGRSALKPTRAGTQRKETLQRLFTRHRAHVTWRPDCCSLALSLSLPGVPFPYLTSLSKHSSSCWSGSISIVWLQSSLAGNWQTFGTQRSGVLKTTARTQRGRQISNERMDSVRGSVEINSPYRGILCNCWLGYPPQKKSSHWFKMSS